MKRSLIPWLDGHILRAIHPSQRSENRTDVIQRHIKWTPFHLSRLASVFIITLILGTTSIFFSAPAHAATALSNCATLTSATGAVDKDYRYGFQIGTWQWDSGSGHVLAACNNWGPDSGVAQNSSGGIASAGYGASFQCVELILRYFNARWGLDPAPWDQDASNFWTNYPTSILYQVPTTDNGNGTSHALSLPFAGDIMVYKGSPGHIAIVASVTSSQIILFEQNTYWPNIGHGIDGATNSVNFTTNADGSYTIDDSTMFGWLDGDSINGGGAAVLSTNTGIGGPLLVPQAPTPPRIPFPESWTGKLANGALFAAKHETDNYVAYRYQTTPGSQSWSAWTDLANPNGDTLVGDPAIGMNSDKRLFLFALGASGKIWLATQVNATSPTQWNAWSNFSNPSGVTMASDPAVEAGADGRLYLFVRDTGGVIRLQNQTSPNGPWLSGGYSQFSNPSGVTMTGKPAVAAGADGRLYLFVRDTGGVIRLQNQTSPNGPWLSGGYSQFSNPSGHTMVGDPVVAAGADGRLYLFVRDNGGTIRLQNQTSPNGSWLSGGFAQFSNPNGVTMMGNPAVAASTDGRLYLFARDSNNVIRLQNQTAPNGAWLSGGFSQFSNPNGITMTGDPAANTDSQGYMSLFVVGADHQMYHAEESSANGSWQGLAAIGGSF